MPRVQLSARTAAVLVAVFLAGPANAPLWRTVATEAAEHALAVGAAFLLTLLAIYVLLLQALAWPRVFKPVAGLLLVISAVCSGFMGRYGVLIDGEMIRNVLETDAAEAGELVSTGLLLHVLGWGVLPALLLATARLRYDTFRRECGRRALNVGCCFLAAAGVVVPTYREASFFVREHGEVRLMVNPVSPLIALARHGEADVAMRELRTVGADASRAEQPRRTLFVFVVGETATASHFALNGYRRDTNPELSAAEIVNFPDVHACGTSTALSVPCMFSARPRESFAPDRETARENLLDILQRTGIDVLWRDNNSGCKGVCDRVEYEDVAADCDDRFRTGRAGCFDEALLTGLLPWWDGRDGDAFVVLHQKGSHGPAYSRRTPPEFKRFLPECEAADVLACETELLVNAYDNTILYTDHVLAALIRLLDTYGDDVDTAMLYVSDHGESLGENGVYLHGFPYWLAPEEQTHVPMVFWGSDTFFASRGIRREDLDRERRQPLSHDNLFHSVLGLLDVRTSVYDAALDVFSACR